MVLGKLDSHVQKNETGLLSYTVPKKKKKINSVWINLNIRPKTVKLFKENIGDKLLDTGLGNDVLDLIPKAKQQKQK